ncbi:hypothetical protein [Sinorhizobium fredii]|uniref:Uncharacterized protein n=1 Tax=Rhizobium fredii TaxID=380 RepID=A0A2A6LZB4_RHIFR|nr:hypothetical protein [Sinorhizobium fredii]ASY68336.1 hypothetical protein SF83666_c08970 [Sinorhizobium fredii CCBAU 83666]PDT47602.1 hypothetical protein CO661_12845 [Sinorhizobium fredii]
MDRSKRNRWRDAALDVVMSQSPGLGEMSFLLDALQEDAGRPACGDGRSVVFRDRIPPLRSRL